MKSRAEKEKEQRRWTTFLQKPNRPIPKTKDDLVREALVPYRVKIVKQPKPRCDPKRAPTPPAPTVNEQPQTQTQLTNGTCNGLNHVEIENQINPIENGAVNGVSENHVEQVDEELPGDDDVPDLEQCDKSDQPDTGIAEEQASLTNGAVEVTENHKVDQNIEAREKEIQLNDEIKSLDDILLERQLAEVQQQLVALSTLPHTIQATLDAVTKQISEILPNFKLRTSFSISANITDESKIKNTDGKFSERFFIVN